MQRLLRFFLICCAPGCSATPQLSEISHAEQLERQGQIEEALNAYEKAQERCPWVDGKTSRREACEAAYLQHAELLADSGRHREAAESYLIAETKLGAYPELAARAAYFRARELDLDGARKNAYEGYWHALRTYPEEEHATDAVKRLMQLGMAEDPKSLHSGFRALLDGTPPRPIVDNLLFHLAILEEDVMKDRKAALDYYDAIAKDHRPSGFFDDALWHGARLARELEDPKGAVRRLKRLLQTRDVAWGNGSYFSVWLDDAQLELGRILRDEREYRRALRAFKELEARFPDSVLIDDAMYERAVTYALDGQLDRACTLLATLAKRFPDSKYELSRAPERRVEYGCEKPSQ